MELEQKKQEKHNNEFSLRLSRANKNTYTLHICPYRSIVQCLKLNWNEFNLTECVCVYDLHCNKKKNRINLVNVSNTVCISSIGCEFHWKCPHEIERKHYFDDGRRVWKCDQLIERKLRSTNSKAQFWININICKRILLWINYCWYRMTEHIIRWLFSC